MSEERGTCGLGGRERTVHRVVMCASIVGWSAAGGGAGGAGGSSKLRWTKAASENPGVCRSLA